MITSAHVSRPSADRWLLPALGCKQRQIGSRQPMVVRAHLAYGQMGSILTCRPVRNVLHAPCLTTTRANGLLYEGRMCLCDDHFNAHVEQVHRPEKQRDCWTSRQHFALGGIDERGVGHDRGQ